MLIADIIFNIESNSKNEQFDAIFLYIKSLYHNGIVLDIPQSIVFYDDKCSCISLIPEAIAVDYIYNNSININMSATAIGLERVNIIGKDILAPDVCDCTNISWTILKGSSHIPLYCGKCNKCIPLYKIKPTYHDLTFYNLLDWNKEYVAWDEISFRSKLENIANKQISDIGSALSQKGLEVRSNIELINKYATYYYLKPYLKVKTPEYEMRRKCPQCGSEWLLKKPLFDEYDFLCEPCRLISSFSQENRYQCRMLNFSG